MIYEHLKEFAGSPVVEWWVDEPIDEADKTSYRVGLSSDESEEKRQWVEKFAEFLSDPGSREIRGLVIGDWSNIPSEPEERVSAQVVRALVAASAQLPQLQSIFFGDIISEESEISWIQQTDLSPLFSAFPNLETLAIRGGDGLMLGSPRHDRLKTLIIQTGGLDGGVVRGLGQSQLPALEHLELWLGVDEYGGTVTPEDLEPILSGERFPQLKYLGLRNSEIADRIAAAVAKAPILKTIHTLDLSLGTLTDDGAAALLASREISQLKKLDLHHHYCTDDITHRLAVLGPRVDVSVQLEPDTYNGEDWRYVSVSE